MPDLAPRPRALAGLLLVAGAVSLALALSLDTVVFQRLGKTAEVYSILGGIRSLWNDGNWILASIVFLFSIVFPLAKLVVLGRIWLGRGTGLGRARTLVLVRAFGRWSMLDVFLIALFVGSIRGFLASSESRVGIQIFAGSIVLSMVAAIVLQRALPDGEGRPAAGAGGGPWAQRALSFAGGAALAAALGTTLFEVRIGSLLPWRDVALPATTRTLAQGGERLLALALGGWVVGASVLRSLAALLASWLPVGPARWGSRARRLALALDDWAMLDVFALALFIVHVKLEQLAAARLSAGTAWLVAAALLTDLDAWMLRRNALAGPRRDGRRG